jgi:hypothetical protein
MSAVALIPDIERVVGDHLRDQAEIAAFDARVAGQIPRSFTRPWIRLTVLDATDKAAVFGVGVEHLISFMLQVDVWAGSTPEHAQAEAGGLARTARAVLCDMRGQTVDGVVIADVRVMSHARIPDEAFDPWRERHILTAEIHAHNA